jgi:hypothetical protein
LAESAQTVRQLVRRSLIKEPDHRHRRLLRARRYWPRRRATEQRYELALVHSITSSAVASTASADPPKGELEPFFRRW